MHESITLQIHPGINIWLQYIRNTSEYILKLQLHQQISIEAEYIQWIKISIMAEDISHRLESNHES